MSSMLFLKPSFGNQSGLRGSMTLTPSTMKQYGYMSGSAGPRVTVHTPSPPRCMSWRPANWTSTLTSEALSLR